MKNHKSKGKSSVVEHDEIEFDEDCKVLIEALVEAEKEALAEQVDPFENYVQRVHSKLCLEEDIFRTRFTKGYHTLIEELKHEQSTH